MGYVMAVLVILSQGLQEHERLAGRAYRPVVAEVLPADPDEELPVDVEWRVIVRIRPAWQRESLFRITLHQSGQASASMTVVVDKPILAQLEDIYRLNRRAGISGAAKKIARESFSTDSTRCPALGKVAAEFAALTIPAALPNVLQMDATQYDILSQTLMRRMHITASGPEPAGVIEWLERASKTLNGCR